MTDEQSMDFRSEPREERDVELVRIASVTGPVVILYGPTRIGKTVTLLRLCHYISSEFSVEAEPHFRDDPDYASTVELFDEQRAEDILAPDSTAALDFLLVNIGYRGSRYCQFLEAPGEHFLPRGRGEKAAHPHYLREIFQGDYRKVYMLFFEPAMIGDQELLTRYSNSLVATLRSHADTKRDRVILVLNKVDTGSWLRGGKPIYKEVRDSLYRNKAFGPLRTFLESSNLRKVHFVPFSAGQFASDATGERATYSMSAGHYPKTLWKAVHDCVKGGWFS